MYLYDILDKPCATPPSTPIEGNNEGQEYQYITTSIPEIMQKIIEEPRGKGCKSKEFVFSYIYSNLLYIFIIYISI